MNILELAGFYSNYGSNFIPSLERLDKKLVEQGHETFYIFSNKNLSKKFFEWEKPFSTRHRTYLYDFSSISFVKKIVSFINANEIDIVHAHFCSSFFLSMIKRRCKRKVLFLEQIHSCPYNNKKTFRAFLKRVRNFIFLEKDITKVCISNSMVPMVRYSFPKQKIVTCINAIDFERLTKSNHNQNVGFSVLLFGHNYYVKGVDVAIKAVLDAKKIINEIHLDIVMGDNMNKNKQRIIKEFGDVTNCVTILEPTHNVNSLYAKHTVFLNASRSEGGSYAIVEAYYSGALCVLSDVPATKESALPNVIYFSSGDYHSLSRALVDAYKVKDSYVNHIEYAENHFSIDSWCNRVCELMGIKIKK